VQEIGLREADDADVFAALRREGEVVFTKDEDFIDIVTRLGGAAAGSLAARRELRE